MSNNNVPESVLVAYKRTFFLSSPCKGQSAFDGERTRYS